MIKRIVSIIFVIALFSLSVIAVAATEHASEKSSVVKIMIDEHQKRETAEYETEQKQEATVKVAATATETKEIETITNDCFAVLIFVVSICVGILLGQAFSFWKW